MNELSLEKKIQIIHHLVEGNSCRATARLAGVNVNTVLRYLEIIGYACLKFHSKTVVQIRCERVQCDEQHAFIHTRDKNLKSKEPGKGSVWTWIGFDPDSKLIISWYAGDRDDYSAKFFMNDLWCRLRTRVQLSTDGLAAYREAVADTFGSRVDFGQQVKQYNKDSVNKDGKVDKRELYTGSIKTAIVGNPNPKYISTALIERQNLTVRMSNRRFTRKTNAHSKKYENHCYALALHFTYYNFVRIHQTLRVTPAMRAGLTKKFMKLDELVKLADEYPLLRTSNFQKQPKNPGTGTV